VLDDIDLDGSNDILIGESGVNQPKLTLFNGQTFDTIYEIQLDFTQFGDVQYVSILDDIDGDFIKDFQVGRSGLQQFFSGRTGQLLGETHSGWTQPLAITIEDRDGDGTNDLLIGDDSYSGGDGRISIYSGSDFELVDTIVTGSDSAMLGQSIEVIQDINGDGLNEIVFNSPEKYVDTYNNDSSSYDGSSRGAVSVISGSDYSLEYEIVGDDPNELDEILGSSIATVNDINADGVDELLITRPYNYSQGYGLVSLHSGADGSKLADFTSENQNFLLGNNVGSFADLNQDGRPEVTILNTPYDADVPSFIFIYPTEQN